jgi:hypothetical protein
MQSTARRIFSIMVALAAAMQARAAEPRHEMYFCVNLSGQGQVLGSKQSTPSGLYRSVDRQKFEHVGFNHFRTFGLTADPRDPDILFVTLLDGILRSPDRGKTWRRVTSWDMTEPKVITFDPHAPDNIYAGLPDGIAVSHDRGETWQRTNAGIRRAYTHPIIVDRTKAGRVLAGTELGIYLSEDGAKTWQRVHVTSKVTYDLQQSPHDPRVFLAATSADGLLLSRDGGGNWHRIEDLPTDHTLHYADFDPHDAKRMLVCGWGAGLRVTEDGGRTWIDRTAGLPHRDIWCAATDPDFPGRIYAAPHQAPVFVSDDFGRTWRKLTFEKALVYDIVFLPRK